MIKFFISVMNINIKNKYFIIYFTNKTTEEKKQLNKISGSSDYVKY